MRFLKLTLALVAILSVAGESQAGRFFHRRCRPVQGCTQGVPVAQGYQGATYQPAFTGGCPGGRCGR